MKIVSIDPGTKKCGIAVVEDDLTIKELSIVNVEKIRDVILQFFQKYDDINVIVLGNKTASSYIENKLYDIIHSKKLHFVKMEEEFSTQEGKEEFIKRKGFWRALFKDSFDEWASFILAKRFIEGDKIYGEKKEVSS